MALDVLSQLIINGLITGSIYAVIAAAFSLTYAITKFIDFAHAAIVLVAAYAFYIFAQSYAIPIAIAVAIFTGAISAALLKNFVYRPFMDKKASNAVLFIASIIISCAFGRSLPKLIQPGRDGTRAVKPPSGSARKMTLYCRD